MLCIIPTQGVPGWSDRCGSSGQQGVGHLSLHKGHPAAQSIVMCFPCLGIMGNMTENGSAQVLASVVLIKMGILHLVAMVQTMHALP